MMHHRTREAKVLADIALDRGAYAKCWKTQHHRTKEAEVFAGIALDRGAYAKCLGNTTPQNKRS